MMDDSFERKYYMKKTKAFLVMFASLLTLWVSAGQAQIIYGQRAWATFGIYGQSWKLKTETGTDKLSQWVIPINYFRPLRDNYELRVFTSVAFTGLDNTGGKNNLNGLNDTKFQAAGSFLEDRYLVSLGINLPSGKRSLKAKEAEIAQFLSSDFLNLPVKNFGEGFNLNLTLARAFEWRNSLWGVGAGYQYNGTYSPYDNVSDYKPGDRLHLTGGVSSDLGNTKLSGDLTYLIYQADKQGGEKIFKDGNQLDLKGGLFYQQGLYSLAAHARYIIRGKDRRYGVPEAYREEAKNHGNDFRVSTSLFYQVRLKLKLIGQAEVKFVGENDYPSTDVLHRGASHVIGLGGGFSYDLKEDYCLSVQLKLFQGEADGGNIDLSGLQMQSSLFVRF